MGLTVFGEFAFAFHLNKTQAFFHPPELTKTHAEMHGYSNISCKEMAAAAFCGIDVFGHFPFVLALPFPCAK